MHFFKIYLYEYKPGYDILYFIYCDAMHNERTLTLSMFKLPNESYSDQCIQKYAVIWSYLYGDGFLAESRFRVGYYRFEVVLLFIQTSLWSSSQWIAFVMAAIYTLPRYLLFQVRRYCLNSTVLTNLKVFKK